MLFNKSDPFVFSLLVVVYSFIKNIRVAENAAPEEPEEPKLTQRLQADGTEVDPGPAGGEASIGEGTSVAEATPGASGIETAPGQTPPPADTNTPAALPVGQKAFFYEERSGQEAGTARLRTALRREKIPTRTLLMTFRFERFDNCSASCR